MLAHRYSLSPIFFKDMSVPEQEDHNTEDAIFFPRTLSDSDPGLILEFCSQIATREGDVFLDASDLTFIDPLGLALLRATLESAGGKTFHVSWMHQRLLDYLIRMDFFEGLNVDGMDVETARNPQGEPDQCVELVKVVNGQSEEIASRLAVAMIGAPGNRSAEEMDSYRRPIEYALKELLENALSHARKEGNLRASVWVACQHFRSNGDVRLAIVDNGCGFLATLREHAQLKERTDAAAIRAALIARVSCNRGPLVGYEGDSQNQGVGLTTTARIAEAADGFLVIASGDACLNTKTDDAVIKENAPWKGVAISFHCNRDKLPQITIAALLPEVEDAKDDDISFE